MVFFHIAPISGSINHAIRRTVTVSDKFGALIMPTLRSHSIKHVSNTYFRCWFDAVSSKSQFSIKHSKSPSSIKQPTDL